MASPTCNAHNIYITQCCMMTKYIDLKTIEITGQNVFIVRILDKPVQLENLGSADKKPLALIKVPLESHQTSPKYHL